MISFQLHTSIPTNIIWIIIIMFYMVNSTIVISFKKISAVAMDLLIKNLLLPLDGIF